MDNCIDRLLEDLVALCQKHDATLFPRQDFSGNMYLSMQVGEDPSTSKWVDVRRVSRDGVTLAIGTQRGKNNTPTHLDNHL